jgi:cell division protein FtsB
VNETQIAPDPTDLGDSGVKWWQRRWVQLVGVGVVSLGLGSAAGAAGKSDANKISALKAQKSALAGQLDTAHGDTASTRQQVSDLQGQISGAQADVARARSDAADALAIARKKVAAQNAATVARLNAQAAGLNQRATALARAERVFREQVSTYNDSTMTGSGLYLVGTDIAPGTYHTTGDDGSGDCYWARLSSTDTSDILDNDNTTGPTTITIYRSDKAFQTDGCADWHKIG